MNENQTCLDRAEELTNRFEKTNAPEFLEEAYESLENVLVMEEKNPDMRKKLRMSALELWIRLVGILDRLIDPAFDPDDVPSRTVVPPVDSDGTAYMPGCAPEKIKDPAVRAVYMKSIAENREKIGNYVLQVELRRLDEQISPGAADYIRKFVTNTPADKNALKHFADKYVAGAAKRDALLRLPSGGEAPGK
jgi:hypothetical protein